MGTDTINLYVYCLNNSLKYVDCSGYDSYIFYLKDFEEEAENNQKSLAKYYGVNNDKVHLEEIKNNQSLIQAWNNMGTVDGQEVSIETVIINTHADALQLLYKAGGEETFREEEIRALNNQNIERLILYGCNAGHLDYIGTNPASQFSMKVEGTPVLASDGSVRPPKKTFGERLETESTGLR